MCTWGYQQVGREARESCARGGKSRWVGRQEGHVHVGVPAGGGRGPGVVGLWAWVACFLLYCDVVWCDVVWCDAV